MLQLYYFLAPTSWRKFTANLFFYISGITLYFIDTEKICDRNVPCVCVCVFSVVIQA